MRPLPSPFFIRLLFCLCALPFISLTRAQEEPLRAGDRIDVTLRTGAIFEYAKVIEVTKDSIMVANPQGVREFAAKNLTDDLQARLPGATPPPAPKPAAVEPSPAPIAPAATAPAHQSAPVDLDALATALSAKLNAAQPQPMVQPITESSESSHNKNVPLDALVIGLLLIIPTLNVLATRSVILNTTGSAVPMWVLAIWLLPLVGCLTAFAALGRATQPPASKS